MGINRQSALTLIARVKGEELEHLRRVLEDRNEALLQGLRGIGTVHYARWVVIDPQGLYPAQLAFESNFDGDAVGHVADLVRALGGLLDEIYGHCEDYTPGDRTGYFARIRAREAAFYQGSPGRDVGTIAREKALRERLVRALAARRWDGRSAKQAHAALRQEVLSEPEFHWARESLNIPSVNWPGLIVVGIVLVLLAPALVLWAIYMQLFHELKDPPGTTTPNDVDDTLIARNVRREDYGYQNQFSQVMEMKPGRARLVTVKGLFLLTRVLIRLLFVEGKLMGIPTIHFARWVLLDGEKRMLFFSNFDGSWTQYLGDFIDKSGWGLNGIFGNTRRFPRIWFLLLKGAYDEMHFLGWSRGTQIPTQVWYAASTSQSIKNVNDNTRIRNELSSDLSERAARRFLARL